MTTKRTLKVIEATQRISGQMLKAVCRDTYRLVISAKPKGVIADFRCKPDVKLRKGSNVTIEGIFKSEGETTLCLKDCRLITD